MKQGIMAEYTRGLDNRENERSGHNNSSDNNTRRRTMGVDFNAVNYEQRRPPYGSSREKDSGMYDNGAPGGSLKRRDEA